MTNVVLPVLGAVAGVCLGIKNTVQKIALVGTVDTLPFSLGEFMGGLGVCAVIGGAAGKAADFCLVVPLQKLRECVVYRDNQPPLSEDSCDSGDYLKIAACASPVLLFISYLLVQKARECAHKMQWHNGRF